jgi:hypothetical protein
MSAAQIERLQEHVQRLRLFKSRERLAGAGPRRHDRAADPDEGPFSVGIVLGPRHRQPTGEPVRRRGSIDVGCRC